MALGRLMGGKQRSSSPTVGGGSVGHETSALGVDGWDKVDARSVWRYNKRILCHVVDIAGAGGRPGYKLRCEYGLLQEMCHTSALFVVSGAIQKEKGERICEQIWQRNHFGSCYTQGIYHQ